MSSMKKFIALKHLGKGFIYIIYSQICNGSFNIVAEDILIVVKFGWDSTYTNGSECLQTKVEIHIVLFWEN